jgi:hypothetical protein
MCSRRRVRSRSSLHTRHNVARSTPRCRVSQVLPRVRLFFPPSFPPGGTTLSQPGTSLLPFGGLPRSAHREFALGSFPIWRAAFGTPHGLLFHSAYPIMPAPFAVAPHACWYCHFIHMLAHFFLDFMASLCENTFTEAEDMAGSSYYDARAGKTYCGRCDSASWSVLADCSVCGDACCLR